jgi:hypothetical protein
MIQFRLGGLCLTPMSGESKSSFVATPQPRFPFPRHFHWPPIKNFRYPADGMYEEKRVLKSLRSEGEK